MADGSMKTEEMELTGLALLRKPFAPNQISKLPKETRAQIEARKQNKNLMVWNCPLCGGHHHKDAVHLDYVGHAALTDRLLDCDPEWSWEPVVMDGLPNPGAGMWIRLTVCGVSRLGYGSADGKQGGDAIKEIIGDALRNAAMRFGAALDLWHKGDLHADPENPEAEPEPEAKQTSSKAASRAMYTALLSGLRNQKNSDALKAWGKTNAAEINSLPKEWADEIRKEYAQELEGFKNMENSEQEMIDGHAA